MLNRLSVLQDPSFAGGVTPTQEPRRATVVVADAQPLFREALAGALAARPELDVVAQAANGQDALRLLREERPAVAVLAVSLPEIDGPTVFDVLAAEGSRTRVMFLSGRLDGPLVHRVVSAGAAAYLTKR